MESKQIFLLNMLILGPELILRYIWACLCCWCAKPSKNMLWADVKIGHRTHLNTIHHNDHPSHHTTKDTEVVGFHSISDKNISSLQPPWVQFIAGRVPLKGKGMFLHTHSLHVFNILMGYFLGFYFASWFYSGFSSISKTETQIQGHPCPCSAELRVTWDYFPSQSLNWGSGQLYPLRLLAVSSVYAIVLFGPYSISKRGKFYT